MARHSSAPTPTRTPQTQTQPTRRLVVTCDYISDVPSSNLETRRGEAADGQNTGSGPPSSFLPPVLAPGSESTTSVGLYVGEEMRNAGARALKLEGFSPGWRELHERHEGRCGH
uniref:Uncharacterized protein n=1 Tax=Mycena chlorophos TaxID=658473 RepID=A0ABQ0M789_MYCCL|nr:predicted protein [Mycena chlorophos]